MSLMLPVRIHRSYHLSHGTFHPNESGPGDNVVADIEFFDLVQTCVDNNLCDLDTAQDFFSAYANWHWPYMKRHIQETRRHEEAFSLKSPYGRGLQKLATKPVPEPVCSLSR